MSAQQARILGHKVALKMRFCQVFHDAEKGHVEMRNKFRRRKL